MKFNLPFPVKYKIVSYSRIKNIASFVVEGNNGTFNIKASIVDNELRGYWYDGNTTKMFLDIGSNRDKRQLIEELEKEWTSVNQISTEK